MEGPRSIFQNALLAQAAYGNFDVDNGSTVYPDNSVKDRIKAEGDADYTNAQAENFAGPQGYALRSFTSDLSTGFEAALFESRVEPGKYTLAIRGTAGLTDILGADIFGLIAQGQAAAQSVSLYRYYRRLTTARGVEVAYTQAEIEMLAAVTNRKYDGYSLAYLRNASEFRTVATGLAQQLKGDTGLGRLDPSAIIDVTGHSLGGHLAQVLGALFFPDRVGHIYTYNGAGLGGSVYKVAKKFLTDRSADLTAKSTNIVAEEGLTLAAGFGYKFGQNQRLAIEAGLLTDNHSITNATDSLALYALLGQASPNLSLDDFNKIIRGATNDAKNGYEATLDILRRMFLGPDIQPTQRSFLNDLAGRDEYYRNIDELKANAGFMSFVGESGRPYSIATLIGTFNPAGLAADDIDGIAYRYALKQLNPFAVVGRSYAQHNQNGELDLYDDATGQGSITPEWLRDRTQFLAWKNEKNVKDIADDVAIRRKDNGVESYLFTDRTLKDAQGQDYSVRVTGGNTLQQADPIRISFATDQGDILQGGNYADHLYGGRGSDTLAGGGGDDYLEGGAGNDTFGGDAGNDTLIGGNGVDTLIGGAGDDTLQGGKGNDILQGGAGNDLYLIRAGDGRDTIIDHEGRNTIGYTDASGKRWAFGVPAFAVAGLSNTWIGYLGTGGESVTFTRNSPLTATLPDGTQIVFDEYQDGEYGIQLKDLVQSEPETTGLTLLGDLEPMPVSPILDAQGQIVSWEYDEDEFGNPITDPSTPAPDREDWMFGSDDDDFIAGFGGKDEIYGGDGADHLQGGAGADYLYGEDGDDVIEGQDETATDPDFDRIWGGVGDDWIFAMVECDIDQALAHANDAGIDSRGPTIAGEAGDDVIVGSAGWDRITGGAGADVLIGGGGSDWIAGDANLTSVFWGGYELDPGTTAADADAIYGGGGDDRIRGGLGDDYVDGGDGDDFITGESGADTLFGGAGDDSILAITNERNDIVFDESADYIDGGDGKDWIVGSAGNNILLGGAGNDDIEGAGGDDFIDGGPGNDRIQGNNAHGGEGNDVIAGTAGADTLYGDDGDDTLSGWSYLWNLLPYTVESVAGDDWLYGGAGNDTYILGVGSGNVHIVDDEGFNRIELMSYETEATDPGAPDRYAPIAQDSIHIEYNDGSYKLVYGDAGDSVDLGAAIGGATLGVSLTRIGPAIPYDGNVEPGPFDPQPSFETSIELLSWSEIAVTQDGAPEGGMLIASEGYANTLAGKAGNDVIVGASREDVLTGGPGDDILDGGDGGDRYLFNSGDGVDVISDSGAQGADTLVFGPGIDPDALSLVADGLLIRIGDSGDAVYVDGFDPGDAARPGAIERFEFADGTVLTHTELIARGFDVYGTDGGDTEFGTSAVDRFHQSAGDDTLVGGAGDDVYFFDLGSGHDLVVDQDATPGNVDTIVFGSGIAEGGVSVSRSTGLLTLAIAGNGDSLDLQWQPQDGLAIERIVFADGTVWDNNWLESQAPPASPADGGAPATGGDEPVQSGGDSPAAADTGTPDAGAQAEAGSGATPPADAGTGTPASDEIAQADNSETPPAETVLPDTVVTTAPGQDTISAAISDAPPAETASADAGSGTPPIDEVAQTGNNETPTAETVPPDTVIATTPGEDAIPAANSDAPPAEIASADAESGTPPIDDVATTGNSATPPAEAVPPDTVIATTPGEDAIPAANGDTSPAGTASADAGTGTPATGEVAQTGNSETPPAEIAPPDAVAATPVIDESIPSANADAPSVEIETADAGTGTPASDEVAQTDKSELPPADVASPDTVIATAPGDGRTPIANSDAPSDAVVTTSVTNDVTPGANVEAIATVDAGTGTPAVDEVAQTDNKDTAPVDIATPDTAIATQSGGEAIPMANGDAPPADIETVDAGTGTPATDEVAKIDNSNSPAVDAAPPAAETVAASDDSPTLPASGDAPRADDGQSGEDHSIAVADCESAPTQEPRTPTRPSERDMLMAALQTVDASGSNAALSQPRNSAKAGDGSGALSALDQVAATQSPASFFSALQPPRPNLQPWLDNWFGPGARARTVERETSSAVATGEDSPPLSAQDSPSPSLQDHAPPDLTDDIPLTQPAEALTPEEIAQSYADIAAWLDLHPGFEQDMAWESGSPPERNPFAFMRPASAGDAAASMAGFGPSPGMTAIGGHALQPLRGISEGCTSLAVI